MPTVYLGVNRDYSSSGITSQGSIDSTSGGPLGQIQPCPGVFPCLIAAKSSVRGNSAVTVDSVYAGPNHLVIREFLHDSIPSAGNRVRVEARNRNVKVVGGTYIEGFATPNPILKPYYVDGVVLNSISLNGLPAELSTSNVSPVFALNIGGTANNPNDPLNYVFKKDGFTYNFGSAQLSERLNALWTSSVVGSVPVSFSASGISIPSAGSGYAYLLADVSSSKLPYYTPVVVKYPTIVGNQVSDLDEFGGNYLERHRRSLAMLQASTNAPTLGGFNATTGAMSASAFGTQTTPNYVRSFAALSTQTDSYGEFSFVGTKGNYTAFIGMFGSAANVAPGTDWPTYFFHSYLAYGSPLKDNAACKPSLFFNSNWTSVKTDQSVVTASNAFWSAAYPQGLRSSRYEDVKAMQYGYVFLNKDTKHLEFMFTAHADPTIQSGESQVINKIMHAPPRSADFIPASNMLLGVDPRTSTTSSSLYNTSTASVKTAFVSDQILHGGGGHVMALGTFNGAIVTGGKVVVWGSNRWGQLILPDPMRDVNVTISDVAVSNSPPVLPQSGWSYIHHGVYSDEVAELQARRFNPTNDADTDIYSYRYPHSWSSRYGNHINYSNLPGHVVVVTNQGWVYAWGNNLYYQCEVPDEISLLDSTGTVRTTAATDPIMEVSAGAFHTVARSKAGVVYVWGAGGPWVSTTGRVQTAGDVIPPAVPAQYKSVHFGQSLLYASGDATTGFAHLATPAKDPPGTSSQSSESYTTFSVYTSVTTISKQVTTGGTVNIGQKTAAGFSVAEPTGATRMKGMIAAGAFHTAIIDQQLKIQCIGAGRGATNQRTSVQNGFVPALGSAVVWGTSYTNNDVLYGADTYPHFCQGLSQYRAPLSTNTIVETAPQLFRFSGSVNSPYKSRYFQDLQFKKVVCGPFSTHGIVFSVSRGTTTDQFLIDDKVYLHGRVVSWGCAFSPRYFQTQGTGCTGILGSRYQPVSGGTTGYNTDPANNPAGTLSGMGATAQITTATPRYFEILNRSIGTNFGVYVGTSNLVGSPSPNSSIASSPSVGVVGNNATTQGSPNFFTDCPVTISRFKVKDMACCGDFSVYIGFLNTFSRSPEKVTPADTSTETLGSGATYDYEASVFFTGNDVYRTSLLAPYQLHGRFEANSPYSGNLVARRNRQDTTGVGQEYLWPGSTAMPMKTRSFHFGPIKRIANGVVGRLSGDSTDRTIEYILPTTALASANLTVAIVNMDNRPVAWLGSWFSDNYQAPIDLSLLPSVPLQSFKVGKAHIMAVTDGDWPVAVGLGTIARAPKIVSELGTQLFTGVVPTALVAPGLITNEGSRYSRPTLISWGAGDGREYGTTLVSLAPPGTTIYGIGSGTDSVFGLGFLDTHAVSRYDATYAGGSVQGLAVNTDAWENYYGHYRWNVNSTYDRSFTPPSLTTSIGSTGGTVSGAIFGPPGHHAVEAMQSLLGFQPQLYPSTFTNPALGARDLLNGNQVAAIPAAAFRPFVSSSAQSSLAVRCCATAAEEAVNFESLNSLLEYHSPLGYTRQTYTDYVIDYAAGSMHSAVLFRSSCPSWSQIDAGAHLANITAFNTHFKADAVGNIHFGQRKVCKLGIVGYGCEGQTAGAERILTDGSIAPLVPRLFAPDAKVYCGESYTLVTNPIRIVEASSGNVALSLLDSGSGYSTQTIPITIPASAYSKQIRGLDVRISVVTSSGTVNLPLSSWEVTIPYKNNTWTVFSKLKANLDTAAADSFLQASTTAATYRFSDRFHPTVGYTYGTVDVYDEQGINPTVTAAYSGTSPYFLRPIDTAAAVPALSKQGCYYPVSVDTSNVVTANFWNLTSPTTPEVVLPFNEPTINVNIKDYTSASSYANCSVNITLEVEVDDGELPYVLYGPNKSGVWNELPGQGPSFGADISAFNEYDDVYNGPNIKSRWLLNCPCEIDSLLLSRKHPVGFLADSKFICGTKKYGPAGNRETAAAQTLEDYYTPFDFTLLRKAILKERVTANFFSVFTTLPHRPFLGIKDQIGTLNPSLQVLPTGAFISTGSQYSLVAGAASALTTTAIPADKANFRRALTVTNTNVRGGLLTNSAILYNKVLRAPAIACGANCSMSANKNLNVRVSLHSTNCS